MSNTTIGTKGFVAWFYAVIYMRIVCACKNIFVRITIHSIGLIAIIIGLFALISTMPSSTSIIGLFMILIGIVVFVTPFGANVEI